MKARDRRKSGPVLSKGRDSHPVASPGGECPL